MSTWTLNVRHEVDEEWMDVLVEMAGYGIGYWASSLTAYKDDVVVMWPEEGESRSNVRRVSYGALARATQKIMEAEPKPYVNEEMRAMVSRAVVDPGDIDSDVADVIVQVALFDEVVYG